MKNKFLYVVEKNSPNEFEEYLNTLQPSEDLTDQLVEPLLTDLLIADENMKYHINKLIYYIIDNAIYSPAPTIMKKILMLEDSLLIKQILNSQNFNKEILEEVKIDGEILANEAAFKILPFLIEKNININSSFIRENGLWVPLSTYAINNGFDDIVSAVADRDDFIIRNQTMAKKFMDWSIAHPEYQVKKSLFESLLLSGDFLEVLTYIKQSTGFIGTNLAEKIHNSPYLDKDTLKEIPITSEMLNIEEFQEIIPLLIDKGIKIISYVYPTGEKVQTLFEYSVKKGLNNIVQALLRRTDFVIKDEETGESFIQWATKNPYYQVSLPFYEQLLVNVKLTPVIMLMFPKGIKFDTIFSNNQTFLHLLAQKKDVKTLMEIDFSSIKNTLEACWKQINLNLRDSNGDRAIDILRSRLEEYPNLINLINLLRNYGSVEPKKLIETDATILKLKIEGGVAPDNEFNIPKVLKILQLLNKKAQLNEEEINTFIENFKNNNNLEKYEANWGQGLKNAKEVVEKLATMVSVKDRLLDTNNELMAWNFKDILGKVISLSEKNEALKEKLIFTLAQLEMCNLSKLIHLLSVVQDEIIEVENFNYNMKKLEDFEEVLLKSHKEISTFLKYSPDQINSAITKWAYDICSTHKDPENWRAETQIIQGIINKNFIEYIKASIKTDDISASYHFIDGVINCINKPFSLYLNTASLNPTSSDTFSKWLESMASGKEILKEEFLLKIIKNEQPLSLLNDSLSILDLEMGDFSSWSINKFQSIYHLMKDNQGAVQANLFAKLLAENCILNSEVEDYFNNVSKSALDLSESLEQNTSLRNEEYYTDSVGDYTDYNN